MKKRMKIIQKARVVLAESARKAYGATTEKFGVQVEEGGSLTNGVLELQFWSITGESESPFKLGATYEVFFVELPKEKKFRLASVGHEKKQSTRSKKRLPKKTR